MGWARLDDSFHDHPKVIGLDAAAVGLWVLALTWAHKHKSTSRALGHVPEGVLPHLVPGRGVAKLAAALEQAGLWDSAPGGWMIHDFADYLSAADRPQTADQVREARRDAGKRGAAARWETADKPPASQQQANGNLLTLANGNLPSSSNAPDPTRPEKNSSSSSHPAFGEFWKAYPRRTAKLAAAKKFAVVARTVDPDLLIAAAARYAKACLGKDPQYIAHPTTWLNQGRWEDETDVRPSSLSPWVGQ